MSKGTFKAGAFKAKTFACGTLEGVSVTPPVAEVTTRGAGPLSSAGNAVLWYDIYPFSEHHKREAAQAIEAKDLATLAQLRRRQEEEELLLLGVL